MTPTEIQSALLLQLTKSFADLGLMLSDVAQAQAKLIEDVQEFVPEVKRRDVLERTQIVGIQIAGLQERLELLKGMIRV